jgi:hypothetical protein
MVPWKSSSPATAVSLQAETDPSEANLTSVCLRMQIKYEKKIRAAA